MTEKTRTWALNAINDERDRQDDKWGDQRMHSDELWMTIALEEFGEIARAMLEDKPHDIDTELMQTTAVLTAWMEGRAHKRWIAIEQESIGS